MTKSKRCTKCKILKPLTSFSAASREKDGLQYDCKECHKGRLLICTERTRKFIQKQKNRPCADCGRRYPWYVMDFDHVRGEKKFDMGTARRKRFGLKRITEEITKCDLVCSNCHRIRTFNRQKGQRNARRNKV